MAQGRTWPMPRHATETFPPTSTLLSLPRQTSEGRSRSVCRNRARPVLSHLAAHGEQPQRWANRYWSTRKLHCQPGLFGRTFSHSLASPWLVLHWIFVSELLGVVCRAFACVSQTNSCGFARSCWALDSFRYPSVTHWQRKKVCAAGEFGI